MSLRSYGWIPLNTIIDGMADAAAKTKYIVSVGSGNGTIEKQFLLKYPHFESKLILVDPSPESYTSYPTDQPFLHPDIDTVANLIEYVPNVVGNCTLVLIWPDPEFTYDIEAVQLLDPNIILMVYEKAGSGGSEDMIQWASQNKATVEHTYEIIDYGDDPYGGVIGNPTYTFGIWLRKGIKVKFHIPLKIEELYEINDQDNLDYYERQGYLIGKLHQY